MLKNAQKGNVYLLLTIIVVAFLTVGTVIYLEFPEEGEKIEIIFPPKEQFKQREIQLSEVLQFLTAPAPKEMSESEKKAMEKTLDSLSKGTKGTKKPPEIQKEVLDSLVPSSL
ncbi:MAG: hypothetical protein NTU58_01005 [Candidatus Nealsonbacteria bacterium]|nr:hypothetical protein [Candidatus Nealsonbacteria bacterium]